MAEALKNVIAQSLECPVCLNTFTNPKILSCSHTYCKTCLDNLLECQGNLQTLRCPVCRAETQVPNQDVSKLPSNLALKSLIEDMKNQYQFCSNCKSEDKHQAVVYCQDCGKYLCDICHNNHSQWQDFISHEVLAISDILSGKVSVNRYRKCRKHPKEDEECFCSDCRRFACFRCVVLEHKDEGHRIIEAAVYEGSHTKSIEDLKSKANMKRSCFQKYVDFIDEQKEHVSNVQKQCTDDINKAYEESVRNLTEKEILIGEVKSRIEGVDKELDEMKRSAQEHITHLTTIADVVTNRTKIPLDMDALAAHDTLCQDLQQALNQKDPDYKQLRQASRKGKSVNFKRNVGIDELGLGKVVNAVEKKNIAFPTKNNMNAVVSTPDGRMAMGCYTGGVEIYSADGQLQQTILKHVEIRGVGFLSDDRYVILDRSNNITLYTLENKKLNVMFETLSNDEGGSTHLTVDGDDHIYVSYRIAQKIQVFSPAGGNAIKEIPCDGYMPMQITRYNDNLIITKSQDTIRLIDQQGVVKYKLTKLGDNLYAAVSHENTILIAKLKHEVGLVSIDEYTNKLKHVQNLVIDYKIEKHVRGWYTLHQYRSGEIAFCTPDRLYIFH